MWIFTIYQTSLQQRSKNCVSNLHFFLWTFFNVRCVVCTLRYTTINAIQHTNRNEKRYENRSKKKKNESNTIAWSAGCQKSVHRTRVIILLTTFSQLTKWTKKRNFMNPIFAWANDIQCCLVYRCAVNRCPKHKNNEQWTNSLMGKAACARSHYGSSMLRQKKSYAFSQNIFGVAVVVVVIIVVTAVVDISIASNRFLLLFFASIHFNVKQIFSATKLH